MSDDPGGFNTDIWKVRLRRMARAGGRGVIAVLRTFWSVVRAPLMLAFNILFALIIIFEEWGWRPLHDAVARLSKYSPVAFLERRVASLPPYGALLAFGIPVAVLLPFKFLALFLFAAGRFFAASFVFVTAKIVGTALLARIFVLTKPALMQIAWFAAAYEKFVPWKDALYEQIRASWTWRYGRMLKTRVRLETERLVARYGPKFFTLAARSPVLGRLVAKLPQRVKSALMGQPKSS